MLLRKKILITLTFLALTLTTIAVPNASAKGNEFDAVCNHIKTKYQAEKVKIPFMWLARFAVGVVRPAGVKSFKVTIFKNLQFSPETLNDEMKSVMNDAFSEEWRPILRIRSAEGNQVYMNMRPAGKNLKILVVSIEKNEAVVVRAKFNPDKLAKFIENPRIFGISLDGKDNDQNIKIEKSKESDKIIYEDDDSETDET